MRISDWSSDVCSSDLHWSSSGRSKVSAKGRPMPDSDFASVTMSGVKPISSKLKKPPVRPQPARSEEHTSELQSLMRISYAVFCLKKKTKNNKYYYNTYHNTS